MNLLNNGYSLLISKYKSIFYSVTFIILLVLLSTFALNILEDKTRQNTINTLEIVLKTTQEAYRNWLNLRKLEIMTKSEQRDLVNATKRLLKIPNKKKTLLSSPALADIREQFSKIHKVLGDLGIFIISPDYLNLVSLSDNYVGEENLIAKERKHLLDEAFEGNTQLVPPFTYDIKGQTESGEMFNKFHTMFIITPIFDENKHVLAVLAMSINPTRSFSPIGQLARIGKTGESYAIDEDGRLLTDIRFAEQLAHFGIVNPDTQKTIKIKDPGGNLLSGFSPSLAREQQPLTYMAKQVTAGESGYSLNAYRDYRGVPVLGAWLWDDELGFGLTTEIEEQEALQPYYYARNLIVLVIFISIALSYLLTILIFKVRKKAEQELREQSEKFSAIVNTSQDWIWEIDLQGIHTYSNPVVEHILGYKIEEIVGIPSFQYIHHEDILKIKLMLRECISKKEGWRDQVIRWQHKDGSWRYLESNAVPIFDAEDEISGFRGIDRDISESKQAMEDLRESEKRYKALFESANDAIFIMKDGTFVDCNPKTSEIFACSKENIIGQTPFRFSPEKQPDGQDSEKAGMENIKEALSGKAQFFEWQHLKYNGNPFDAEVSLNLIELSTGKHLLAIVRDITERKIAEVALSKSEARYRKMIEDQTELIVRWRPDGIRTFVNESYCSYYGISQKDAIGTSFFHILSEEEKKNVQNRIAGLTFENPVSTGEHKVLLPDGSEGWNRWTDRALFDEEGNLIEYQSVGMDITEQKRSDEAIRESEERFRILSESAFEGIGIVEKGIVINANKKLSEMLGVERDNLIGMSVSEFVAPESRSVVEERIKLGAEEPYEHYALRHDGSRFPVEVRGKSLPYHGRMFRVTAIRDITEQKKLQEQLLQAQKMESIGQLAAGVAHDYNNILTAIIGFAQLASMKAGDNSYVLNYLNEILDAGDRASKLTSQLLTFSRKQVIEPKIIDVNSVIQRMDKMLYTLVGENIQIEFRLAEQINPIKADLTQLEQILVNLIINARDAIIEGSIRENENQIIVETKEIELDAAFVNAHPGSSTGHHILLSVSDSGAGMSKEKLSKIFEPFFTTKEEGKGTGLGLATVYGIVKQNKGSIYVYSEPGEGSTFNIYWPGVNINKKQIQKQVNEEKIIGGKETILVVEDDNSVVEFVRSFLSSLGYEVITKSNGKEALKFSKENPGKFQLLLTDVIMPKMNGEELAKELYKFIPDLKVIYASGYSGDHISESGVLNKDINFINKPYSMHTLAKKIREVLDKN